MKKSIITVGYASQENTEFGILSSSRWKYTVNTAIQKKIKEKEFTVSENLFGKGWGLWLCYQKSLRKEQKDGEKGKGQ